ncbi:hypothetical protein ACIQ9R_36075 [Streptomyces sp. NPDC094447]|uniref:hypothetical protein n=1 Tax=Streptomyces sp. NPDC094447 TaxID=3366062 RepID=UPI003824F3FB
MTTRSTSRPGRPTLLTPVVIEKLGQAVEAGLTRPQAAEAAGVTAGSFARWMTRGRAAQEQFDRGVAVEESEQPYGNLYRRIMQADTARQYKATVTAGAQPVLLSGEGFVVEPVEPVEVESVAAVERPAGGLWSRFRSLFARTPQTAS